MASGARWNEGLPTTPNSRDLSDEEGLSIVTSFALSTHEASTHFSQGKFLNQQMSEEDSACLDIGFVT